MKRDDDLFSGKTFEQQVKIAGGKIEDRDISPNVRIAGEIVVEPIESGVRVTARGGAHRLLWGCIVSAENVRQIHRPVATYGTFHSLVEKVLLGIASSGDFPESSVEDARKALDEIEKTAGWLRRSLDVVEETAATRERARTIARIASDAERQIRLEAASLKGMKPRGDASDGA